MHLWRAGIPPARNSAEQQCKCRRPPTHHTRQQFGPTNNPAKRWCPVIYWIHILKISFLPSRLSATKSRQVLRVDLVLQSCTRDDRNKGNTNVMCLISGAMRRRVLQLGWGVALAVFTSAGVSPLVWLLSSLPPTARPGDSPQLYAMVIWHGPVPQCWGLLLCQLQRRQHHQQFQWQWSPGKLVPMEHLCCHRHALVL